MNSRPARSSGRRRVLVAVVVVLGIAALAVGGTFLYARFLAPDARPELSLPTEGSDEQQDLPSLAGGPGDGSLDGTWTVAAGSQAGYRVDEVLSGQPVTAVGRTEEVSGQVVVEGGKLTDAQVAVEMASVATDQSARDAFFRQALQVEQFPQAQFVLQEPVDVSGLSGYPAGGTARGTLTVRGVEQEVVADLRAHEVDGVVQVSGAVELTFEDFGVTAPDLGFVTVEPTGVVEFLLTLER